VTSAGSSIFGPTLSTSGGTAVVMKDTDALGYASVDRNGKISLVNGVSPQSSAALTLTNGYNNVHGFIVNEVQATMSGGVHSSSLTLNDNGATFSRSETGRPIQVHGVADGTSDFDAVNVRQLHRGVAASMASVPQVSFLKPGEVGVGIGFGNYGDSSALGLSMSALTRENVQLNLGVAHADGGSTTAVRGGIGWKFGW
jgi:hypothetical protein